MRRMGPSIRVASFICAAVGWLLVGTSALVTPIEVPASINSAIPVVVVSSSSPFMDGTSLLTSMKNPNTKELPPGLKPDTVVRVLDANTLKLKKNGVVTLAGVRTPTPGASNFQFPECLSYTPAYKLRQLIPPNSDVLVKVGSTTSAGKSVQAIVVKSGENAVLVNQELVRTGFGKVQKVSSADLKEYLDMDAMQRLEARAKEEGIGIFRRCDMEESSGFEAQFEPLELTMETKWGDDGGKLVPRQKDTEQATPQNPGNVRFGLRGCSDFSSYEDALRWYEKYFPFYGDVAKLDRNGDGVPCPGLPHTKVAEMYRMKVPSAVKQ